MINKKNILLLILALLVCSCGVTESGNPCRDVNCTGLESPDAQEDNAYTNNLYGVRVSYPDGWTVDENSNGDGAQFTSGGTEASATGGDDGGDGLGQSISTMYVTMEFSLLDSTPASLISYLESEYPERTFDEYETDTLSGYEYDDPEIGEYFGDVKEYYFLNGDVLIQITTELVSGDQSDIDELLNGISFE